MKQRRALNPEEIAESGRLLASWKHFQKNDPDASQEWLAHECGWKTQGAAHQYLNGLIPLNLEALLKLCRVLDVDPTKISPRLTESLANNLGVSNQLTAIQRRYRAAKPEDKLIIEQLLSLDPTVKMPTHLGPTLKKLLESVRLVVAQNLERQ